MTEFLKRTAWYLLRIHLLTVYLTFHHLLNAADSEQIQKLSAAFLTT